MLQNFPTGNKSASAQLKKGFSLIELGKQEDGVVELRHVIQRYPKSVSYTHLDVYKRQGPRHALIRMENAQNDPSRSSRSGRKCRRGWGILLLLCIFLATGSSYAQDWVRTGSGLGVEKVRLAVPDFKAGNADPQDAALLKTFNDTFWSDLDNSGVVELVSKSFYPLQVPGQTSEVTFGLWNACLLYTSRCV